MVLAEAWEEEDWKANHEERKILKKKKYGI